MRFLIKKKAKPVVSFLRFTTLTRISESSSKVCVQLEIGKANFENHTFCTLMKDIQGLTLTMLESRLLLGKK